MRRIPAAFLVVLVVFPLFLAALYTTAVATWMLDRSFYRGLLSNPGLYEVPLSAPQMQRIARWTGTPEIARLPPAAFARALREVFPPAAARAEAVRLLEQALDFTMGAVPSFDPALDLTGVKAALAGEGGRRFAAALAAGLPACAPGAAAAAPGTLPLCRPSNTAEDRTAEAVLAVLPALRARIPDRVVLLDQPLSRSWIPGAHMPSPGRIWPGAPAAACIVLLMLACGSWVGAAFLGGYSVRERLLWLGWSLFPPAVLVFLTGLGMSLPFVAPATRYGLEQAHFGDIGFGAGFVEALYSMIHAALGRISAGFLATGAIAGGLAIGLAVWGHGMGRPAGEDAAKTAG